MPAQPTDQGEKARDNPASADLERTLLHYRPALLAIAFDRLGCWEDAEDVAQEALARAWQEAANLRDPQALPAWLRTVTINLCRERWRRPREDFVGLQPDVGRTAEDTYAVAVRRETVRQVHRTLQELPENNRLALMMHVMDGLSYEDISQVLQVPVTTVEGRIYRARQRLRKQLAGWLDDTLKHEGED